MRDREPFEVAPRTRTSTPPRPARSTTRSVSAVLFLVAGVCAIASAFVAWWSYTFNGFTMLFLPGASWTWSAGSITSTQSFASTGLGPVGSLYEAILALAIIAGLLGIVAGSLGLASVLGRRKEPRRGVVEGLVITTVVLLGAAAVLAPAIQPWAINDSTNHSRCNGLNGTSPCSSFWGSQSGVSWGPAIGWYLAATGLALTILGLWLWGSGRTENASSGTARS